MNIIQIQVSVVPSNGTLPECWTITALCDDGTIWEHDRPATARNGYEPKWVQLPGIPHEEATSGVSGVEVRDKFESWAKGIGLDLRKGPSMMSENPYNDGGTWKAYEAWCACARSR